MSTTIVQARPAGDFLARAIRQPLYDRVAYPAAGALALNFFTVPCGQAGKTYADSNLLQGGKVGGGQRFYLEGFNFQPDQRLTAANQLTIHNDWAIITSVEANAVIAAAQNSAGLFRFGIGSVNSLLTVPISLIPSGVKPTMACTGTGLKAGAAAAAFAHVGIGEMNVEEMFEFKMVDLDDSDPENPAIIKRRYQIMSEETFNCSLEYQQGLAPLAVAALNLIVTMQGILIRGL